MQYLCIPAALLLQRMFIGFDWANDGLETVAKAATPTKGAMYLATIEQLHSM